MLVQDTAALSCDTTEFIPPEKSMPTTWLAALAGYAGTAPPGPSARQ
jgi:hypothetical protein